MHARSRRAICYTCAATRRTRTFDQICAKPTIRRDVRHGRRQHRLRYCRRLLEEALGMKFRVISGYPGGADQDLAMERGEVHCRAFIIESFFATRAFRNLGEEKLRSSVAANGTPAPSQAARRADGLRIDGPIQSVRFQAALGQYLSRHLGIRLPTDRSDPRHAGGSNDKFCAMRLPRCSRIRSFKKS